MNDRSILQYINNAAGWFTHVGPWCMVHKMKPSCLSSWTCHLASHTIGWITITTHWVTICFLPRPAVHPFKGWPSLPRAGSQNVWLAQPFLLWSLPVLETRTLFTKRALTRIQLALTRLADLVLYCCFLQHYFRYLLSLSLEMEPKISKPFTKTPFFLLSLHKSIFALYQDLAQIWPFQEGKKKAWRNAKKNMKKGLNR